MAGKNTYRKPKPNPTPKIVKKASVFSYIKKLLYKAVFYFLVISIGSVVVFKFIPIPFTWTMVDQKMESIMNGEDSEMYYAWRSYSNVSREMHLAVVAAEDQLFPDHFGFDFKHMQIAYKNNLKGKKVRGASTSSQKCISLARQKLYQKGFGSVFYFFDRNNMG
jgi:monofunctional biosynthetic peptidoglycan transglycosylase